MLKQGFCTLFLKQLQSLHCVLYGKAEMTYNINWTESSYNSYSSRNHETPSVLRLADFCWLCTFTPSSAELAELWWIWLKRGRGGRFLKDVCVCPSNVARGRGVGCHGPSREQESGHPDTFSDTLSFPFFTANRKRHSSTSALFLLPPFCFLWFVLIVMSFMT